MQGYDNIFITSYFEAEIVTDVDKCNICGPSSNKVFNVPIRKKWLSTHGLNQGPPNDPQAESVPRSHFTGREDILSITKK